MVDQAQHKSKFIDFRTRRSVHIALYSETHKDIRKALVERDLSLQELFQRFAELVVNHDKRATRILDDLERDKRSGNVKRVKVSIDKRSANTIYDMIAAESDIEKNTGDEDDDTEDDV